MFGKLAVQTYANASACVKTTDDDISSIKSISEIALFQHSEPPFKEFEEYQWDAAKIWGGDSINFYISVTVRITFLHWADVLKVM